MTKIIDGKQISSQIKEELRDRVSALRSRGVEITLAVIIVGEDPASKVYVNNKKKACEFIGIRSLSYELPETTTEEELMQLIQDLNGRTDVLVGTVEGWPGYEDVALQVKASGSKRVRLAPLMLVAGDHAVNDMAGSGPDSWASRLTVEGCQVRCTIRGLGQLPAVRGLYRTHLESVL